MVRNFPDSPMSWVCESSPIWDWSEKRRLWFNSRKFKIQIETLVTCIGTWIFIFLYLVRLFELIFLIFMSLNYFLNYYLYSKRFSSLTICYIGYLNLNTCILILLVLVRHFSIFSRRSSSYVYAACIVCRLIFKDYNKCS